MDTKTDLAMNYLKLLPGKLQLPVLLTFHAFHAFLKKSVQIIFFFFFSFIIFFYTNTFNVYTQE